MDRISDFRQVYAQVVVARAGCEDAGIRAAFDANRHAVIAVDGVHSARSPGHGTWSSAAAIEGGAGFSSSASTVTIATARSLVGAAA